jgi:hypothetical protein
VSKYPPSAYLRLTAFYSAAAIESLETAIAMVPAIDLAIAWSPKMPVGEEHMKIYLLLLLIGTLWTAIRFTAVPERRPDTLPQ